MNLNCYATPNQGVNGAYERAKPQSKWHAAHPESSSWHATAVHRRVCLYLLGLPGLAVTSLTPGPELQLGLSRRLSRCCDSGVSQMSRRRRWSRWIGGFCSWAGADVHRCRASLPATALLRAGRVATMKIWPLAAGDWRCASGVPARRRWHYQSAAASPLVFTARPHSTISPHDGRERCALP